MALSPQQVEERTGALPDGTSSTKTLVSQICRDSAGRMRIEWSIQNTPGGSSRIVDLIDPVARSMVTLPVDAKIASYFIAPHPGSGLFQVGFPAAGQTAPANWQTKTEALGTRVIDGVEVEGERTVKTSEDQPPLVAVQERWPSRRLDLTREVDAWGPDWKHTAKLQNVDRPEPDPALFVIPADYAIRDR